MYTSTHPHDQSCLASLAFGDPDKNNPLHDQACRYLTLPENVAKIASVVLGEKFPEGNELHVIREHVIASPYEPDGRGGDVIGFLDMVVIIGSKEDPQRKHHPRFTRSESGIIEQGYLGFPIEIKIEPVSVREILQQIYLYRQYIKFGGRFCLVAGFLMTKFEIDVLNSHDIVTIRLGNNFTNWVARENHFRQVSPDPSQDSLVEEI